MFKIIKRLLPLLLFTSIVCAQSAPDTLWTRTIGDALRDRGYSVRQTSDGGFIVAGMYGTGSITIDLADFYLLKFNASGDTQWTRRYGGAGDERAFDVRETPDGGYYVGGYTYSFGHGGNDIYLIRTDAQGDTLWTRTYGTQYCERAHSMDITSDGGCILAGETNPDTNHTRDIYAVKVDSAGEALWTFHLEDEEKIEYVKCIRQTLDGGYIMTGISISDLIIEVDCFLVKLSADGQLLWRRDYDFNAHERGNSVCEIPGEGYIIAGQTEFNNFTITIPPDILLIRTNYQGDVLWTREYGDIHRDWASSVCTTLDGGFVFTGYNDRYGGINCQLCVSKVDANGDSVWTKHFGSVNLDYGYCVQQTADEGYVISGVYGMNRGDVYLIRLESDAVPQVTLTLTPSTTPVQIPSVGGTFQFEVSLISNESYMVSIEVWIEAALPAGRLVGPLLGPAGLSLAPNGRLTRNINQSVPAMAPAGEYRYIGYIGEYPDIIWEESSFPLTKLPGEAVPKRKLGWSCHGWFDDESQSTILNSQFSILNSSPNPFNAKTALSYKLQAARNIRLAIYDINGREIAVLAEGFYPAGTHQVEWDASGITSGVYFVRLKVGGTINTRKLLLLK